MSWRQTDAVSTIRQVPDQPRAVEGIAIPYGVVSLNTDIGAEAFAPGSFRDSVNHWMGRQDGARMAFRPAHRERPIGTIQSLEDTPVGVQFRASIFDSPAGDQYLAEVSAGLNGVSVEFGPGSVPSRRLRDGTMLHREAKLHAIAGSISPAYDGARVSVRDMEDEPVTEDQIETRETPAPDPEPEIPQTDAKSAARSAAEAATVRDIRPQSTISRAEAVYGPRSGQSFFSDMIAMGQGNGEAAERQGRHQQLLTDQAALYERAGDVVASEIPGAYPNEYLPGLLLPRLLKGRPMGGFFTRVAIDDAQPKIYPKVTTSTTVAVQSAEGANPAASDLATTAVTVTPLLYGGHTLVSRQVLDGASPSIDQMLMTDLLEAYSQSSETVIKTAVEAGAATAGTAITAATPFAGCLGNVIEYQGDFFNPAQGQFIPPALYAVLLAQSDGSSRPLLPFLGPMNSAGTVQAGATGANLLGADVLLSWASTTNVVVTARRDDFVIFESSIAQFRYDQPSGPSAVDIGIWAYLVVGARRGGNKITAA
jgi:HK97 family phage prohead protease